MQELLCDVRSIEQLGRDVQRVELVPTEGVIPDYVAGQYLTLHMSEGQWIPFSIGNAPEQKSHIELHVRQQPGHALSGSIIGQLQDSKRAHIQMPMGRCVLRDSERDVVCIVGGTGFSPIKAMLESAFAQGTKRAFKLFWGAQTQADLYLLELAKQWQQSQAGFSFEPVVAGDEPNWQGARGLVHHAALEQLSDLQQYDFYISGSGPMVLAVYEDLLTAGALKQQIFADMLDIKRDMGEDL